LFAIVFVFVCVCVSCFYVAACKQMYSV